MYKISPDNKRALEAQRATVLSWQTGLFSLTMIILFPLFGWIVGFVSYQTVYFWLGCSLPVRRTWHDDEWFYSIIDIIAVLVPGASPSKYWFDIKRRVADEGFTQLSAKIRQLKLPTPDGKKRATDTANMETVLRIIQSIPDCKNCMKVKHAMILVNAKGLENSTHYRPSSPARHSYYSAGVVKEGHAMPLLAGVAGDSVP